MPYVNNNGVKIYYEVEGQGQPLVLAHGFGNSLSTWRRNGYTNALRNDFQLVLFDRRGHGRSDKPHEPAAYGWINMANDVVAVLDGIGISRAYYWGYSGGARLGFWLATHVDRFHRFILNSMTPYRDEGATKSGQDIVDGLQILLNDPEAYLKRQEQMAGRPLPSEVKDEMLANDAQALMASTMAQLTPLNDGDLALISVPCLILCGDLDLYYPGAKEAAMHIPNAEFISLPGLTHVQAQLRADLVLPHVKKFLAEVSTG